MDAPDVPKPDLFSKIGPLPAWAWGAIVVGGYLIYRRMTAYRPVPTVDPGVAGDALAGEFTGVNAGGGGGIIAGGGGTGVSGSRYTTNNGWGVSVIGLLSGMGYPAGAVTTAITSYLLGLPLTAAEASIVQDAIANFGPPPEPLPIVKTDATAATSTTTPVATDPPVPAPSVAPAPTYPSNVTGLAPGGLYEQTAVNAGNLSFQQPTSVINSQYQIDGRTVYLNDAPGTLSQQSDLALLSNPYLAQEWKDAARARLAASGITV